MSGYIYIVQDENLISMKEQTYDSEPVLQKFIADHPDLLAGDQINPETPRRWLLVEREISIPSEQDAGARWFLDHLFIDQDAIPTLVEVKRSSDTRIRREVIGQMLDYAANASEYWPIQHIRAKFEERCKAEGEDPDAELRAHLKLEPEDDTEQFWEDIGDHLREGRIRMLFVADHIPSELRRVVEFLNRQMNPAEVLAVEIRQFVGQGLKTLVPRVLGQTAETVPKGSKQWGEVLFFADLANRFDGPEVEVARKLLASAQERGLRIWWGKGRVDGSFFPVLDYTNGKNFTFSVWTNGYVELLFQYVKGKPPFDNRQMREDLAMRFNQIPGISIPPDGIERRPSFSLSSLAADAAMDRFFEVVDWMLDQVKASV